MATVDTTGPIGRMLVQMLGVFAEFERETIIEPGDQRHGSQGRQRQTGRRTRPLTTSRSTARRGNCTPSPPRPPWLAEIFRMYTRERHGTRNIAAELNRRGARTSTGKSWSAYRIAAAANRCCSGDQQCRS
jgi:site-specific DNA recombinase